MREESLLITSCLKLSEVDPNIKRFWPQTFLGGGRQKCWDLDYKTEEPSDHVAKFHGDRPMELGDLVLKKKKERNISSKT